MGMVFVMQTISDENIEKIISDPLLIHLAMSPDDPEVYLEEVGRKNRGFFSRLFRKKELTINDIQIPKLGFKKGEGVSSDLDKAWHGIHYMLTLKDWDGEPPLNFIANGGRDLGNIDVGFGPARAISASEVLEINSALKLIDESYLASRFNAKDMMKLKIYPEIWDRDPKEDDTFGYCLEYFEIMKKFFSDAKNNGLGMLMFLG